MIKPVINSRVAIRFLLTGLVVSIGACSTISPTDGDASTDVYPDPSYSPEEVVAIQLEALGRARTGTEGIEIAFRFASPANRAATGPVHRFAGMLEGPVYGIMLDYERVEYGRVIVRDRVAVQPVTLYRGEDRVDFLFQLRKQVVEPYRDCWMTDGVLRIDSPRGAPSPELPQLPELISA
ncbi:MAG: DUF4864 domain-containing protein [Spirochaetaceae bacterium]|nr:MAG: DUF4864 domain-containing protein [Spirochaetaceae bacterium]